MPPEIFASYSRENQAQVFPIVDKLRERGLNIWIDQEGIHGAKLWSQEIVNAIESSKVFILFASNKAFLSKNVTKELALASESDKHILPIFIEDAEIPAAMKYQLAGIQHLVHEQGQTDQTADNILRTLGNLDIQSAEPQPTAAKTPLATTKPSPKTPLVAASFIIALAVIAFLLFRGNSSKENPTALSFTVKSYKSTIDLCVITIREDEAVGEISKENRTLRDELITKLTRFHEYKIIKGETLSPDATSLEYIELSKKLNSDFILQIIFDPENSKVITQLFDGNDGRSLWSKSIEQENILADKNLVEESTAIIAGNIAGYDGVIHRKIRQKALLKNEDDLNPIELLQIGKAAWEDMKKDNILKAIRYLEKCISLNPKITMTYAALCGIYTECLRRGFTEIPNPLMKAKQVSRKALELDPKNAMALNEKFWLLWYEKDYSACELHLKLALDANPYEPYVLISAGSFKVVRDIDIKYGLELCDRANRYNERPQGWYNWPYIIHYSRIGEYKKSLEHVITADYKDDNHLAQTAILYWLNGEKDAAMRKYREVKRINKNYSFKSYENLFIKVYDCKGIDNHIEALKEIEAAWEKQ